MPVMGPAESWPTLTAAQLTKSNPDLAKPPSIPAAEATTTGPPSNAVAPPPQSPVYCAGFLFSKSFTIWVVDLGSLGIKDLCSGNVNPSPKHPSRHLRSGSKRNRTALVLFLFLFHSFTRFNL
ncbi:hypothetical protein F8388_000696 [Cannabis sativa]|uniref:Uncharacterized protein n=1 Tax=Cannabis sativa TaxID=3483 RepID=A0A7J6EEZ8_CANSA|nr:hypothetical protein F8388_000696 [Cannabis sativa]